MEQFDRSYVALVKAEIGKRRRAPETGALALCHPPAAAGFELFCSSTNGESSWCEPKTSYHAKCANALLASAMR